MTARAEELRLTAIRPALLVLEPLITYSRVAENQILGDWAHESGGFQYRRQLGGGPGTGLPQFEEPSFRDVYVRYLGLPGHHALKTKVDTLWPNDGSDPWLQIEHNDKFAAGIHRIKYAMSPRPLAADPNDVFEMARTWKAIWNTPLGAGTPEQWIADYRRYVEDVPDA